MQYRAPEIVSIAGACLGGLQGRSALLIGPQEQRYPYMKLLRRMGMKYIYEEDTPLMLSYLLPHVQLLINVPLSSTNLLTAASIAKGREGQRMPLLIFDLAPSTSVEELVGLLPEICLYTPGDLRHLLVRTEAKAS